MRRPALQDKNQVKYLGFGFYMRKGKWRLRVHPKSVIKFKKKLYLVLDKGRGPGNVARSIKYCQLVRGWINYFYIADMKSLMKELDEWVRRHVRADYWRQWKRVRTRYRRLGQLGVTGWRLHEMANCRKGTWRAALMLNSVLTNEWVVNEGWISLLGYYLKKCS